MSPVVTPVTHNEPQYMPEIDRCQPELCADPRGLPEHTHHVARVQLAAPPGVDLSVDRHVARGDQDLALASGVDEIGELEELSESDHVAVDCHVTHRSIIAQTRQTFSN